MPPFNQNSSEMLVESDAKKVADKTTKQKALGVDQRDYNVVTKKYKQHQLPSGLEKEVGHESVEVSRRGFLKTAAGVVAAGTIGFSKDVEAVGKVEKMSKEHMFRMVNIRIKENNIIIDNLKSVTDEELRKINNGESVDYYGVYGLNGEGVVKKYKNNIITGTVWATIGSLFGVRNNMSVKSTINTALAVGGVATALSFGSNLVKDSAFSASLITETGIDLTLKQKLGLLHKNGNATWEGRLLSTHTYKGDGFEKFSALLNYHQSEKIELNKKTSQSIS